MNTAAHTVEEVSKDQQNNSMFMPVYLVGLHDLARTLRKAYCPGEYGVGFYSVNPACLEHRIGFDPVVMILQYGVPVQGTELGRYLRRTRVPVLLTMSEPIPVASLPREYYYHNVYETISIQHLKDPDNLHHFIDLGVKIMTRIREAQNTAFTSSVYDPRASSRVRKQIRMPKPFDSWADFVSRYGIEDGVDMETSILPVQGLSA